MIGLAAASAHRLRSRRRIGDGDGDEPRADAVLPSASPLPVASLPALAVNASSASVRTATPVGPFGRYGFASSAHAVPAMSRCAHGRPPANSFRNIAAVIDAGRAAAGVHHVGDLALAAARGTRRTAASASTRSPARSPTARTCSTHASGVPKRPLRRLAERDDARRRSAWRRRPGASRRAAARTRGRRRESAGLRRRC